MKSLDTNILLYAINNDCPEHGAARAVVDEALRERQSWIVADQVWFELYRLLRNPAVLAHPLESEEASSTIVWYREKSGWLRCAWEPGMMDAALRFLKDPDFPARRVFDLVLGITLLRNGVDELVTRNTKDFGGMGFAKLRDPFADAGAGVLA